MKKGIKWILILGGALFVLVLAALLIIPFFVDVQHYKPRIEKLVSQSTGRPFTLGGDLDFSLFPWVGVAMSDARLGNPPQFQEKEFVSVGSFEVRIKLLPLLSKEIEMKRFVLADTRIVLEKTKRGQWNFEGMGQPSQPVSKPEETKTPPPEAETRAGLPIKTLAVGELAIENASIVVIDHGSGDRKEISHVNLRLENVSLERPIRLAFSAKIFGQPISLGGKFGPLGTDPLKATIPMDLLVEAFNELEAGLKGTIANLAQGPQFDLDLGVPSFSPRKLLAAFDQPLPIKTADPGVLGALALKVKVKGSPKTLSLSDGLIELDDSSMAFSAHARELARPDLKFNLELDRMDIDRYLPSPAAEQVKEAPVGTKKKQTDYGRLRSLVVDGSVKVGEFRARGAKIQDLNLKISGQNGQFRLDPLTLELYEGHVAAKGLLDVQQQRPKTSLDLNVRGIQAGPLLKDVLDKDFLEGTARADVVLQMIGDDAEQIKKSLNGNGDFLFKDGAVKGIDLPGMVRNAKAAFGLAEKGEARPRTDFSELHIPWTITRGLVNSPKTSLLSPLIRVVASGEADLTKETLNFRVEPKFVATLKGQDDTMDRSGVMVPVLVTGSFSSPKFRPDLKGVLQKGLEGGVPEASDLKKLLPLPGPDEEPSESLEEKAKGLIKGLPLGR